METDDYARRLINMAGLGCSPYPTTSSLTVPCQSSTKDQCECGNNALGIRERVRPPSVIHRRVLSAALSINWSAQEKSKGEISRGHNHPRELPQVTHHLISYQQSDRMQRPRDRGRVRTRAPGALSFQPPLTVWSAPPSTHFSPAGLSSTATSSEHHGDGSALPMLVQSGNLSLEIWSLGGCWAVNNMICH